MEEVKAGGYISKIHFNDGTHVDIQPNDIIIFVGPNNAGKSQSLKDIYLLSSEKFPTTIVSDIAITKYTTQVNLSYLLNFLKSMKYMIFYIFYNIIFI